MKIEEVMFQVAGETLSILEQKYHYRIPDEHKRDIQRQVMTGLNDIIAGVKKPAVGEEAEVEAGAEAEGES
jgi:hypothetical protein